MSSSERPKYESMVQAFVQQIRLQAPEMLQKLKVHLLLHLPENLLDYGPPSDYNTERYTYMQAKLLHGSMSCYICTYVPSIR